METEYAARDGWHHLQYLHIGGPACIHTHMVHWHAGMAGCWSRFIFAISALHPLGSTLSQEHRQGFITVYDSRYGAVCTLQIHCPPGSGFIQSHTPSFEELNWCMDIHISTGLGPAQGPWWQGQDPTCLSQGWEYIQRDLVLNAYCFSF